MAKKVVKKEIKKEGNTKAIVEAAIGVAAIGAAAYLLFGPEGNKNRKKIKGWAIKMKGEIIEEFEKAKEITEPVYHKIVDKVHAKYSKVKSIDPAELEEAIKEIKKHWKAIAAEAMNAKGSKKK